MNLLQPWVTEETSEVLILVVLVGVVAEEVESKLQLRYACKRSNEYCQ